MAQKAFHTQLLLVLFLIFSSVALLLSRTVDLQGFRGQQYFDLSEENRLFRWQIPAERGVIFDRYGIPLTHNFRQYYRVAPDQLYSDRQYIAHQEALEIMVEHPEEIGYELERQYTLPEALSHLIGYVGAVEQEDLTNDQTLGLSDTIGKAGLEKQYDAVLRGEKGYQEFEIDALGNRQKKSSFQQAQPGRDLKTSLDGILSQVAWQALGDKKGAVVIMDPDTGEILSLLSAPGFDSNIFGQHRLLSDEQKRVKQAHIQDENKRFFHRAIAGTYPPGSLFKLVTASAGLENQSLDSETTVDDQGTLEVGEYRFANWYFTQYGRTEGLIGLVRAIARSNDIFFYKAAELVGVDDLVEMAEMFGFGSQTGVELIGEKAGLVPNPTWKEQTFGERWFLGNTFHMGIGQGDLLVTPLQQAVMVGAFIQDGRQCQPTILEGKGGSCADLGFSDQTVDLVQQGMEEACSPTGTAYPFFPWNAQEDKPKVLCKTGTAEFGGQDDRGYRKTHAWFGMGIRELEALLQNDLQNVIDSKDNQENLLQLAEEPERDLWLQLIKHNGFPDALVIMVLVESDEEQPFQEGSRDAAPVAKEIFDWIVGE